MKFSLILMTVLFFLLPAKAQVFGVWQEKANMPTALKEISNATAVLDGKIYVVGGVETDGSISNKFQRYDPQTNQWATLAPYPIPIWRATATSVNGRIYVFGGYQIIGPFPFDPTDRVFEYNPQSDNWNEKQAMPEVKGSAAAVNLIGQIHVIGGANSNALNSHHIFDPISNQWFLLNSTLSQARSGLTANVINGKIYAVGGYFLSTSGVEPINSMEVYDPANTFWTFQEDMPIARLGLSSAVINEELFVFGGAINTSVPTRTLAYSPAEDEWRQLRDIPKPVSFAGAAAVNDIIYVMGGGQFNLTPDGIDDTFCLLPYLETATEEAFLPNTIFSAISVFPNPSKGIININLELKEADQISIQLLATDGRLIQQFHSTTEASFFNLTMQTKQKGLYFLRILLAEASYTKKIVFN